MTSASDEEISSSRLRVMSLPMWGSAETTKLRLLP